MNTRKLPWRLILPIVILFVAVIVFYILKMQAQPVPQNPIEHSPPLVAAQALSKQRWPFIIESQAVVSAKQQTQLSSEVTGKVELLSSQFETGRFVDSASVLLQVSDANYIADYKSAQATLSVEQANLQQELALGEVAEAEWQSYGEQANALALRKPQIAAQQAKVAFAQAQLDRAKRELQRTKIKMPYDGVIVERLVSIGDLLTPGTRVAKVIATAQAEVRLPLTLAQYQKLQASFAATKKVQFAPIAVELFNNLAQPMRWQARLDRIEQLVESDTQIFYAIAVIDDPYNLNQTHASPLAVGQFVKAEISLNTEKESYKISRSLLTPRMKLLVANDGKLRIRTPNILHQDQDFIYVDNGLKPEDLLIVSALSKPVDGMSVRVKQGEQ
ncbi:membrane-fusion protein [Catenovulum agarivorans DS-2]|uniref:Membrane-fusion protein n=1 Tax=Catenovulum agarivorans DS-2 TaxID=1328313 RepID=W7QUJ1_9ALTE|nr:efflux RND transporter periplasmic adaptor subunit [Catenovulum agarivorans]EWH09075.1 membrane-fusion protein [Catenovulum agarivorans DS-2]